MQVLNITVEHIFLACGFTDMRKSVDGLAAIVQQKLDKLKNEIKALRLQMENQRKQYEEELSEISAGYISAQAVWPEI